MKEHNVEVIKNEMNNTLINGNIEVLKSILNLTDDDMNKKMDFIIDRFNSAQQLTSPK